MPDYVLNRPELLPGLELYLIAFHELSSCRPPGYAGDGPIPWTAMQAWANEHTLEGIQREDLFNHVRVLDLEFLKRQRTEAEKAQRAASAGAAGKKPTKKTPGPGRKKRGRP